MKWVGEIFYESEVAVYKNTPPQVLRSKFEVEVPLTYQSSKNTAASNKITMAAFHLAA